ncbi:VOC family protein [Azohydromonas caseinilytica]|uniref:Glyoxalase/bleomycin resistance/extradiol dioxygenase family protein n=1 Tax=Azohydromonas caseinilytica TaxID=2728836 RepID=A0A848F603_9BURK|nr:VOC family protein [Azohydromonas caseinilytica]NML14105.1 glyoxalase/bleomycin resistance/extradiol dioxygenase family protein [Azohydromonas caseinilytica]
MHEQIYLNLPVKDLQRSIDFFTQLGFTFDERFSNELATCMEVGPNIHVMLLTEPFFQGFIGDKQIADARRHTEALICLSCHSRAQVDGLVQRAAEAGGRIPRPPQDQGFVYGHAFEDLDGHIWELMHLTGTPPKA